MFARLAAFFGAPPPESPLEPRSSTHEWLEQVKPGYAERFGGAFDELGIEDTDDLLHLDDELYTTLQQQLEAFGARSMHRFNIQRALHEFLVDSDSDWLPPQMEETGNGGGSSCRSKKHAILHFHHPKMCCCSTLSTFQGFLLLYLEHFTKNTGPIRHNV